MTRCYPSRTRKPPEILNSHVLFLFVFFLGGEECSDVTVLLLLFYT